jgi:N-6 DNA Methylase
MGIDELLQQYGGDSDSLLRFDDDGPQLLPYATLTATRGDIGSELAPLIGVYEWQDRPLIVLADGDALGDDPIQLKKVRRIVAMRGDAPYLAVVKSGRMTVYGVSLDDNIAKAKIPDEEIEAERRMAIPHLANSRPQLAANSRWISKVILDLLKAALDSLVKNGVSELNAISLVGRALFVRFLDDRALLPESVHTSIPSGAAGLFDTAKSIADTSEWLNDTFNGDFLQLAPSDIESLPPEAFGVLGNIMHKAPDGQLPLKWEKKWENLDFAHIPVGVLSQAYEHYLSLHKPKEQRKKGSYYTPPHIANLMVRASFSALRRAGSAHAAKVLDPAAGAGVFLITAFRQLVAERWVHDGKRPDTKTLRDILNNQIRGFDINESALRFAALGLYLVSIELDPNPEPVEKLKFDDLRTTVLLKFGDSTETNESKDLGSLGDDVGPEHLGAYDLVIGNPPWSSATDLDDWSSLEVRVLQIARKRLSNDKANAPLPKQVLDLPFVWLATQWARPNAQIAFALHARLLFQRGLKEGMASARSAIFGALDVTGIVNGAEVRSTQVWPSISAPFCLFFARNAAPAPSAGFSFVSPQLEGPLNQSGGWRIDPASAQIVTADEVIHRPELLKILFRGTRLDLELYDRVAAKSFPTLGEYWSEQFGGTVNQPKNSGSGYKLLHECSRPNNKEGGELGYSTSALSAFPVLNETSLPSIFLDVATFPLFQSLNIPRLDQRRSLDLYKGPMLLVHKSPPQGFGRIRTAVAQVDLVFSESFYGYTAHQHAAPNDLAGYLSLIISSKIALWHVLITSGEFGFEREVVEKFVVQEVPLPPFEDLAPNDRKTAASLFSALAGGETNERWAKVDQWVGSLFGLSSEDVQTISDTLDYRLPFQWNQKASQVPISPAELDVFRARLGCELQPWGERFARALTIRAVNAPPLSPWRYVYIGQGDDVEAQAAYDRLAAATEGLGDRLSATEMVHVDEVSDCLILGRLNQARYWSVSQARLVARRIIWEHIDFLSGKKPK